MPQHTDIGARLRDVRKRRGLNQRELATASGVSLSLIRKLEQGQIAGTRMETARRLAIALRVPTTSLLAGDAHQADETTTDQWAPVRAALDAPPAALDEEPTTEGVGAALAATKPLLDSLALGALATLLPPLLRDADALAGADRRTRTVQGRALQLAGWVLTQTHQYEAAADALDRALDIAADRIDAAATINTRCWLFLRQGRFDDCLTLATTWADDIEPRMSRATPGELASWGWMLLRVAAAAVRDNRPGDAATALRLARTASVMVGHEDVADALGLRTFGPATVTQHAVEHANIGDRPDRVLSLVEKMPPGRLSAANRGRHALNIADAHARLRDYGAAVAVLRQVHEAQPEWLAQQRYGRDIVGRVIGKRRTLTPEMRVLADAVRLPL